MNTRPSNERPKLIVFASGLKIDDGGSGFENLVKTSRTGVLDAEIVAVVSNHENGGTRKRADRLGIKFIYFPGPFDAESYRRIVKESGAEWIALSGWLKMVKGLDPRKTFNIHPALLSQLGGRFGGPSMYGPRIHEAVKAALDAGEITESGLTMHFVTDEYDRGPVFFEHHVPLRRGIPAQEIERIVNIAEHEWQPKITNMVIQGEISWDGKDPTSLKVPSGYEFLPFRTDATM